MNSSLLTLSPRSCRLSSKVLSSWVVSVWTWAELCLDWKYLQYGQPSGKKRLCENDNHLVFAWEKTNLGNFVMNEIEINLNMFRSCMENRISKQVGRTDIVTPKYREMRLWNAECSRRCSWLNRWPYNSSRVIGSSLVVTEVTKEPYYVLNPPSK